MRTIIGGWSDDRRTSFCAPGALNSRQSGATKAAPWSANSRVSDGNDQLKRGFKLFSQWPERRRQQTFPAAVERVFVTLSGLSQTLPAMQKND
ncbi:hypothetical protein QM467_03205 [Rhodoblastus sp. 17X3]|uniref:hypothetical protein n=1 Tax=Rhodoblastus sp. 17X3 TaxID=3047026 RepID=UPI0024B8502B|nr:hypothetical protein [Rhodoblastus sp. 17X3]MDI9847066.1 hypothetical protein [Rhodoblastus sp. 17X3]